MRRSKFHRLSDELYSGFDELKTMPKRTPSRQQGTFNKDEALYGVLETRNIRRVVLGDNEFDTWYGNAAYFNNMGSRELGFEYYNRHNNGRSKIRSSDERKTASPAGEEQNEEESYWLEKLHVCEYCFKYTANEQDMSKHRINCEHNTTHPHIGKLLYRDDVSGYLIRQVRGFQHRLFCQNLSLFGKLFLDDKSVYYNVDCFDFYVVYGIGEASSSRSLEAFVPMGFFSKELSSLDNDNNLACICIFPPYQRRKLGTLLIEFSYALAKVTSEQEKSGPELPLSPFGRATYLKFWSVKLSSVLVSMLKNRESTTLSSVSQITGFREEDILITLEYMGVLRESSRTGEIMIMLGNVKKWCEDHHIDPYDDRVVLKLDYLLV